MQTYSGALYIVDFAKPFNLFVDASLHTVSAVLTQTGDDDTELPVAFSREQQTELLAVLDRYPECFSDVPGLTDVTKHSIPFVPFFKPKRLHAYRVPERLKPEVDRQIQEMLDNGIIRPSHSPVGLCS